MRSLSDLARVRIKNKRAIKRGIQNVEDGMMHYPVADASFMNNPVFGIVDCKPAVWPVAVSPALQFIAQLKQIIFQIPLKLLNIRLAPLAAPEFLPGKKQVLNTYNFLK